MILQFAQKITQEQVVTIVQQIQIPLLIVLVLPPIIFLLFSVAFLDFGKKRNARNVLLVFITLLAVAIVEFFTFQYLVFYLS